MALSKKHGDSNLTITHPRRSREASPLLEDPRLEPDQRQSPRHPATPSRQNGPARLSTFRLARKLDGIMQDSVISLTPGQDILPCAQEPGGSMRRKRYQKGSLGTRKHGRHKVWVAQWWDDGQKRSKVLGRCSEVVKGQAESTLAAILRPLNKGAGNKQKPVYTFKQYVEGTFLPVCRRKWKESTRFNSEQSIKQHLIPEFAGTVLSDLSRERMQDFLDEKAVGNSQSVVAHLRWFLSAIFKMAISDGVVQFNPTLALYTPACKAGKERMVLEREQIRQALEVLNLKERLLFRMALFEGMRPGEILAIRIGSLRENSVLIDKRVYRGMLDSPKGRKGKQTARTVALSPGTVYDLKLWREKFPCEDPNQFLFPSETMKTPLSRDNAWRRDIQPKLQSIGLEWASFQVLRRTNASLSRKANIDDKVAADQRGHGLGVSLEVYAVSDLQQKIEAVTKLESEVLGKLPKKTE